MFKSYFNEFVTAKAWDNSTDIINQVDWDAWVFGTGLPPIQLDFTTPALLQSKELANQFIAGTAPADANATYCSWDSNLKQVFADTLLSAQDQVSAEILTQIDATIGITDTQDPEVKQRWFPLGLKKYYEPVTQPSHDFISSMGRMKYLTPIYTALMDSGN